MARTLRLAVYQSGTLLRRHALALDVVKVGTLLSSDLRLDDAGVSSLHALLQRGPDGWTVVDLGSRTGTFVNGERVGRGAVAVGDRLQFGGMTVHVVADEEEGPDAGRAEVERPDSRLADARPFARSAPTPRSDERARKAPSVPTIEVGSAERLSSLNGWRLIGGDLFIGGGPFESLDPLSQLERVVGSLSLVQPKALRDLVLVALTRVEGDLKLVTAPDVTRVWLPKLGSTRNLEIVDCRQLAKVELPALARTAGGFIIGRCPSLERVACRRLGQVGGNLDLTESRIGRLDLPVLEGIGGRLVVNLVPGLTRLELPALRAVGERLVLGEPANLRELELPALERIDGSLHIYDCHALEKLDVRKLRHIGDEVGLLSADTLEVLELPELETVGRRICIAKAPRLRRIVAPKLRHVGAVMALNNLPALVELHLPRLERAPQVMGKGLTSLSKEVATRLSDQLARHDPSAKRVTFLGPT